METAEDIDEVLAELRELQAEYETLDHNYDQLAAEYDNLLLQHQLFLASIRKRIERRELQEAADEIQYHLAKLGYFAGDIRVH